MNNNPIISIITVVYNSDRFIERTINSIAAQSYENTEYIIIDGGSTDDTLNIINNHRDKIQVLISEPDNGLYDAMNKGIKAASGDYLCFINSGDELYTPDTLSKLIDNLRKNLPDIIYGETVVVDSEGKEIGNRRLKIPHILTWRSFRKGMLVCHQSFIVKRSMAPLFNLRYRFSADFDWAIQCMKKAQNIHNTKTVISKYMEEGETTNNLFKSLRERFSIMSKYYGVLPTFIRHLWFLCRLAVFYIFHRRY